MGNKPLDLEALREALRDTRLWVSLGIITRVEIATDRSTCRVMVSILPERREIVARMTWEDVGPSAGWYCLPSPSDWVLLAMPEGDENQAYVIKRLSSKEDKIPLQAVEGDTAIVAKASKKLWLTSAERINLSAADTAPTQNLVLGQVFKAMMSTLLDAIASHTHTGNQGFPTSAPLNATAFTNIKSSPIQNEAILSDLSFTE